MESKLTSSILDLNSLKVRDFTSTTQLNLSGVSGVSAGLCCDPGCWVASYNYSIADIIYRIERNDNQIDVKVLLPEVKMEDIKLLMENNVLTIQFLNYKKYTFFNLHQSEYNIGIDSDFELKVGKNAVLQAGVLSLSLTEVRHIKSIKITEG